ncbi:MAG: PH domain-containing protein [Patescibacteria group bacterium]
MFRLEAVIQLKEEESVKALARRHIITIIPSLFLSMVLIVLPFFFMFPLFGWGTPGIIIFGVLILAGAFVAFRTLFMWDEDVLILTNQRVIDVDQKGLFSRKVTEMSLSSVQDVSWKRHGFLQTIFRMGSINIQSAAATSSIEGTYVARPEKLQDLINELRGASHVARPTSYVEGQTSNVVNVKEEDPPVEKDRRTRIRHIAQMLEGSDDGAVMQVENLLEKMEKDRAIRTLFAPEEKKL